MAGLNNDVRMNIMIDQEVWERLKRQVDWEQVCHHDIIERALTEYLAKAELWRQRHLQEVWH